MVTPDDIINYYNPKLTDEESIKYLNIHAKRYAFLHYVISKIRNTVQDEKINILDIGPSFLTEQIQNTFPNDTIYSLGYSHPESKGGHFPKGVLINKNNFIHFNLNDAQNKNKWVKVPSCRIVILSEVIEHLYTSPKLVVDFIKSFLEDDGILIIQTPNAVSLDKRLMMFRGRNFMELIRENDQNPGHFREYTKNELFSLAKMCNFRVVDFTYSNYFNLQPVTYKVIGYRLLQKILGKPFKDGMTIILKKET